MTLHSIDADFVRLLETRARDCPGDTAFGLECDGRLVSYGELAASARRIAAGLIERSLSGERLLLLIRPGSDFLASLFGCWYAGATAVPLYPPRPNASQQRLRLIARDCAAAAAIVSADDLASMADVFDGFLEPVTLESIQRADGNCLPSSTIHPDQLAVLQYTSGSTGTPKGVRLLHRHLIENCRLITRAICGTRDNVFVSWLPPYHDMGLIGGLLQPIYAGCPVHLMQPADFLLRPMRWLEAISRHRATISAAPNFAYDLCVRRASPDRMAGLDLSSWRVACNGAEPVRVETLRRFSATFAAAGFDARAFVPCYGMAEATLMVTSARVFDHARCAVFDRAGLGSGRLDLVLAGDGAIALVSSGPAVPGVELAIVDPISLSACEPGRIGEIWIAGDTVADGYWQRPEATRETFDAVLPGDDRPWLRSGDLGGLHGGELFVTGRLKDLIVIRGQNHYPQDIEATALAAHPALRPRGAAAFAIDGEAGETLALVLELERRWLPEALDAVRSAVTDAVSREHQLQIGRLALVAANAVPKTSSGKVQRREARARLLEGGFEILDADQPA